MTHRDGFPWFSARSAWRGDARHRKPCATPSAPWPKALGKPPVRSRRPLPGPGARGWRLSCRSALHRPTLYQGALIMTHRDRAGDTPGRRKAAGDAGHRQGFPTPATHSPGAGSPARPERRLPKGFRPGGGRRRAWLAMPGIAAPRAPGRKPWETVSMGHYQRSLVLGRAPLA